MHSQENLLNNVKEVPPSLSFFFQPFLPPIFEKLEDYTDPVLSPLSAVSIFVSYLSSIEFQFLHFISRLSYAPCRSMYGLNEITSVK